VLKEVAAELGFNMQQFAQTLEMLKAQHEFGHQQSAAGSQQNLDAAYKALGVTSDISDRDLKKAYRKMMSQYHPDKMIAKGVPEDMLAMATEKAQEIQAAYDLIEKSRKA
jgi:DnaJ like chaperone protein